MNIVMMSNSYFPMIGGVEHSIRLFSNLLRQNGHQVMIVAPSPKSQRDQEDYVVRMPALEHVWNTPFSVNLPSIAPLEEFMKSFKPDIIHSHYPFFMGDIALRLSRIYHLPLVYTHHVMFQYYTHYFPFKHLPLKAFMQELAVGYANLTDSVIAPSQGVASMLKQQGVKVPIHVVPTGVDLSMFKQGNRYRLRQHFDIADHHFVVGYVGRLAFEKNIEFLVKAVIKFMRDHPLVHFLVVGDGPLWGLIEVLFDDVQIRERLHITGFLQGQELVDAYHAMDVFAFSSITESQGMVISEAMASRLPVVAVNAMGVNEMVVDGVNGRLVKMSINEFVEALAGVYQQTSSQRALMAQQAFRSAMRLSIQSSVNRLGKVYAYLLNEHMAWAGCEQDTRWCRWMNRLKTEADIFRNIMHASQEVMVHG